MEEIIWRIFQKRFNGFFINVLARFAADFGGLKLKNYDTTKAILLCCIDGAVHLLKSDPHCGNRLGLRAPAPGKMIQCNAIP